MPERDVAFERIDDSVECAAVGVKPATLGDNQQALLQSYLYVATALRGNKENPSI